MTALSSASRPLQRLVQTVLIAKRTNNGVAIDSICHRCKGISEFHTRTSLLAVKAKPNFAWGNSKHVPTVATRKGKRQRLIEAGKKQQDSMVAPKLSQQELRELYATELFVFRSDVASGNIPQAIQALENMLDLDVFTPNDSHNLTQAIHQAFRSKILDKKAVIQYLKSVISYIQSGQLPTHYRAHVHILSTLKETEDFATGNAYWTWLKSKGVEYLDARVFGAAIEYLAYQGVPLQDLEGLYTLALKQFSEVHDDGGGVQHRATKLTLIQGIATARLLHHDWTRAYEALDAMSRLNPTQVPNRAYEIFIFNRPIKEGFLVFLMACRAGTKLAPTAISWVMSNWWKSMKDVVGLLQVSTAYFAVGGKPSMEMLNVLVFGFLGKLPEAPPNRLEGETEDERKARIAEYIEVVSPVFGSVGRVIELFRLLDVEPSVSTYNTIITQASQRGLRDIVNVAMAEVSSKISKGEFKLEESVLRVQLNAYGHLKDQNGIKIGWENLTQWRQENLAKWAGSREPGRTWVGPGKNPKDKNHEVMSWKALIRACFNADMKEFLLQQLNRYEHEFDNTLTNEIRDELKYSERKAQWREKLEQFQNDEKTNAKSKVNGMKAEDQTSTKTSSRTTSTQAEYEQIFAELEDYVSTLETMEKVIRSSVSYNFSSLEIDHKLLGLPKLEPDDVKDLEAVYEHFQENMPRNPFITATHDPKTDLASLAKETEGEWGNGRSTTGYTVNQLRFENWLTINRLLFLAEMADNKTKINGFARREGTAKAVLEKLKNGGTGTEWTEDAEQLASLRAELIGLARVPFTAQGMETKGVSWIRKPSGDDSQKSTPESENSQTGIEESTTDASSVPSPVLQETPIHKDLQDSLPAENNKPLS